MAEAVRTSDGKHTTYCMRAVMIGARGTDRKSWEVRRRYSEFHDLHTRMKAHKKDRDDLSKYIAMKEWDGPFQMKEAFTRSAAGQATRVREAVKAYEQVILQNIQTSSDAKIRKLSSHRQQ